MEQEMFLFGDIIDNRARGSPAMMLFDELFLSQFNRNKHESWTQFGNWLENCRFRILTKIFICFKIIAFLVKPFILQVFHTLLRIAQEPFNISKIWLTHLKLHYKSHQNHYKFDFKILFHKV